MEIKINREIRDYQENIFFGLNLRQLVFSILAVGMAVAVYFLLREPLGTETVSWLCILCAAPFAALGFVKYNGMTAGKFVLAYIRSEWRMPRRLCFGGEDIYCLLCRDLITGRTITPPKEKKNTLKKGEKTSGTETV